MIDFRIDGVAACGPVDLNLSQRAPSALPS